VPGKAFLAMATKYRGERRFTAGDDACTISSEPGGYQRLRDVPR